MNVMKNTSVLSPHAAPQEKKCDLAVQGLNGHLHAANCGHKSYVHAGHICYEVNGKFQMMHDSHAHVCAGPNAPQPARPISTVKPTGKVAPVISLDAMKAKAKKK
jgi:hypothetical protein